MYRFAFVMLLSLAASTTFAASRKDGATLNLNAAFAQQKDQIERDLGDGETYAEISSQDRATVREALNRIASKLDAAGGVESMTGQQKADVFNDQEKVNTILTKASEDSRLVCRREKKVGSHREITECLTVAERRRAYENAQKTMRDVKVPTLEAR
jgi:Skp family chaperone for outer membrane proteins